MHCSARKPSIERYVAQEAAELTADIARLLAETIAIQPDWRGLVIAGGGSALADALGQQIDSLMVTLLSERPSIDALALAQDASLDIVICEDAARRVKDVTAFLHECRRTLTPGGRLVLWELAIIGPPRAARYINTLESFRDPAHEWAYSLEDWESFLLAAGLERQFSQTFTARLTVDDWAGGYLTGQDELLRAHVLVRHAPPDAAGVLKPQPVGLTCTFERTCALIIARKPQR
jgi:SAM-dependent methyltransferase